MEAGPLGEAWAPLAFWAALSQEMAVFRGEAVIPLLPGGMLQGLLILGEKIGSLVRG